MNRLICLLALLLLLRPCPAAAHDPMLTGLKLQESGANVAISVTTHESRLKGEPPDQAIRRRLKLRINGEEWTPGAARIILDEPNDVVIWQSSFEGSLRQVELGERLFPEDPFSRTLVSIFRGGGMVEQAVVNAENPSAAIEVGAPRSVWAVAGQFLHEGVIHIFGGIDHVLFVLGLLLLGGGIKELLKTVTAFTVAHSITLTLAATGVWTPPARIVEPIIALSIIAIAVETLRPRKEGERSDYRPWLAFGFGLIHGFGFAGALAELGLPREALAPALAAFNLGVELGQAAIVLAAAPLLALLARRLPKGHRAVVVAGSLGIAAMGAYWFVERISGA